MHIKKKCVIKNNEIIGMFSVENIKNTKAYKNMIKSMGKNLIDVSNGHKTTLILTKEGDVCKGYITKFVISTIEKRILERK